MRYIISSPHAPDVLAEADTVRDIHMHLRALYHLGHGRGYRVADRVTRHVHVYRIVKGCRRRGASPRYRPRHVHTLAEPLA